MRMYTNNEMVPDRTKRGKETCLRLWYFRKGPTLYSVEDRCKLTYLGENKYQAYLGTKGPLLVVIIECLSDDEKSCCKKNTQRSPNLTILPTNIPPKMRRLKFLWRL